MSTIMEEEMASMEETQQGFNPIYRNSGSMQLTSSSIEPVYITPRYDRELERDVIFWEDIVQAIEGALYIQTRFNIPDFVKREDVTSPPRINMVPGVILDIVVENKINCQEYELLSVEKSLEAMQIGDNAMNSTRTTSDCDNNNFTKDLPVESSYPKISPDFWRWHISSHGVSNNTNNPATSLDSLDKLQGIGLTIEKARGGDAISQMDIGVIYDLFHKNGMSAADWYIMAANQGLPRAQHRLGYLYGFRYEALRNREKTKEWYFKAAKHNDAFAQNGIGIMYQEGEGLPLDYDKAMEWYLKSASQGYSNAQRNIGNLYYYQIGVVQNLKCALEWYHKSASQGNPMAQNSIGIMHYHNQCGKSYSPSMALEWYLRAVKQGDEYAQRNIGELYYRGEAVEKSYPQAMKWYLRSARQGNLQAQYQVGCMYIIGVGVPQSYTIGAQWVSKSAEQGHPDARLRLASLYEHGHGVPQDYSLSCGWYQKSNQPPKKMSISSIRSRAKKQLIDIK